MGVRLQRQPDKGIPRHMALGAPSPVEHPGRNLQEAVCLRTVQSAAKKHAIGLLDDRVNPHLVSKPGMMRVQNLTPDGLVGVLKPSCTMAADRSRALTPLHRIKPTSTSRHSAWRPNHGRRSTFQRGDSVQTTGTNSTLYPLLLVTLHQLGQSEIASEIEEAVGRAKHYDAM